MATYDHEFVLIKKVNVEDEIGNQTGEEEIPKQIYGNVKSVGRMEYYNAAAAGYPQGPI